MTLTEHIDQWPEDGPAFGHALRALILDVADKTGAGTLTETFKWGQPAFLTEATKSGTTLRLGYKPGNDHPGRIFVHCGTTLVDSYRERFSDVLRFEGNRAVCLPLDLQPEGPIRTCIAMALTYHHAKKGETV